MESEGTAAVWSVQFARLWAANLFGSAQYHLLQTLLPLVIVERGGGAVLVGLAAVAFSAPSIFARPILGHQVDVRGDRNILMLGSSILTFAAGVYWIGSMLALFAGRVVQGIGWGALNTGGYAMLARLAPVHRRGEASGHYAVAPALAQLAMPALAVWLFARSGSDAGIALAVALGAASLGVVAFERRHHPTPRPLPDPASRGPRLGERSALLPMSLEAINSAIQGLFTFFMPVIALAVDMPLEQLALYYPAYGTVLVVGRLLSSRASDRIGRETALIVGSTVAGLGLLVGAVADDLLLLTLAGCIAALSGSFVTPTLAALTIDRADPRRVGAAVATYSLGYQIGAGAGGIAWGAMISSIGPRSPFAAALVIEGVVLLVLVARWRSGRHKKM